VETNSNEQNTKFKREKQEQMGMTPHQIAAEAYLVRGKRYKSNNT
jgi:hypothetical protein